MATGLVGEADENWLLTVPLVASLALARIRPLAQMAQRIVSGRCLTESPRFGYPVLVRFDIDCGDLRPEKFIVFSSAQVVITNGRLTVTRLTARPRCPKRPERPILCR